MSAKHMLVVILAAVIGAVVAVLVLRLLGFSQGVVPTAGGIAGAMAGLAIGRIAKGRQPAAK